MARLPYDAIVLEANKIIMKMVCATDQWSYHWEMYINFINACGWTRYEFDQETLLRVDANWDIRNRLIWN